MHIGLNTLSTGFSGSRSYAIKMATQMPIMFPEVSYTIFVSPSLANECDERLPNVELVVCEFASRSIFNRVLWEQLALPVELKKRQVDLLYTFAVIDIFLAPCPTVIRVGNMLPYDPNAVQLEQGVKAQLRLWSLYWTSRLSARSSDCTLVMSEAAGRELVEKHNFPANKTIGINRAASSGALKLNDSPPKDLPSSYILIVSHLQRYKKLGEVLEAYSMVARFKADLPHLLIVGAESDLKYSQSLRQQVKSLGLEKNVVFFGKVDRGSLYSILIGSTVTLFPSIVETYPVTLLEQMLVGSTLIVSNRGVMPAFGGDAVLYYDPDSPAELAEQLTKCLENSELRAKLKEASKRRANELNIDWDTAIKKRHELFSNLIRQNT